MTNIRSLIGSLLVLLMLGLGGWVVWRSLSQVEPLIVNTLPPLNITADQLETTDGLVILGQISADPGAQFELPVPRPAPDSVGKQNLFQ